MKRGQAPGKARRCKDGVGEISARRIQMLQTRVRNLMQEINLLNHVLDIKDAEAERGRAALARELIGSAPTSKHEPISAWSGSKLDSDGKPVPVTPARR